AVAPRERPRAPPQARAHPALSHGALRGIRREARRDAGRRRQPARSLDADVRLEHEQQRPAQQLSAADHSRRRRRRHAERRKAHRASRAHAARESASDRAEQGRLRARPFREQHRRGRRLLMTSNDSKPAHVSEAATLRAPRTKRRAVLLAGFGALLAGLLPGWPRRALSAERAVTGLRGPFSLVSGLGGNVLVRATAEGQTLVDSGAPGETRALVEALESLPGGGRVDTVINTHW